LHEGGGKMQKFRELTTAAVIRKLIFAWLLAVTLEFLFLPSAMRELSGISVEQMSWLRVLILTTAIWLGLAFCQIPECWERWGIVLMFGTLCVLALCTSFEASVLGGCAVLFVLLVCYGFFGAKTERSAALPQKNNKWEFSVIALLGICFVLFVSAWTVCRLYIFSSSTYDMGIFSQMFYHMKAHGTPITTLERSTALSHFDVHMSPIYYLMLPFYCLFPSAATLQVLQAVILASAVIPLWKLAKLHGLSPLVRTLLCAALLIYPAYAGGTSYDLHENCFLTPLLLWTFYAVEKQSIPMCAVFSLLTLSVKEDAAVYIAVIAIWLLVKTMVHKDGKKPLYIGLSMLLVSVAWFLTTTWYLQNVGDGVMNDRYANYYANADGGLMSVIKTALVHPMKVLFESFAPEKIAFILQTMLPLLFLPLFTRHYERFLLLIPYFLVNLMSDYSYQHDILFQYTYGPLAFLFYLTAVNLSEMKKLCPYALAAAVVLGMIGFGQTVYPKGNKTVKIYQENEAFYERISDALEQVPEGASVTATAFYTPHLGNREILYDLLHCTTEQLFSTEYVVLQVGASNEYQDFNTAPDYLDGYQNLTHMLHGRGYRLIHQIPGVLVIYQK